MSEINGNELLSIVDDAVLNFAENSWEALFALNDAITEQEDVSYALTA